MFDDETGAEPKIISASFADPFVLLLRDDSSIYVAQCDEDNELEEIEREDDALLTIKWLAGCLYHDTTGIFSANNLENMQTSNGIFMFLLSATGALHVSQHLCELWNFTYMHQIYALPNLSKAIFVAEGLTFVPPVLSAGYAARKSAARETISEIIVADLGDDVSKVPYLIVSLLPIFVQMKILLLIWSSSGPPMMISQYMSHFSSILDLRQILFQRRYNSSRSQTHVWPKIQPRLRQNQMVKVPSRGTNQCAPSLI